MARITEAALDETERRRLHTATRRPELARPRLHAASSAPLVSVALIAGGAGAILAPDRLPLPAVLLAIVALAAGGWLARGGPDTADRAALARERAEINRVLVALALRADNGRAGPAGRPPGRPESVERGPDAGVHPPAGRGALHSLEGGADSAESLEPDADDDGGPD